MTVSAKARRVVALAYDGAELLDLAGALNVLTAATRLAAPTPGYAVEVAARTPGMVVTAGGVGLEAKRACSALRGSIDTLIVPGSVDPYAGFDLVPAIRRLAMRSRRIVSVCSGSFLLAEAGLLEGKRAACHWAGCALLAQRFPGVDVDHESIFVRDGHLWTSAGVSAGMDLALALVEEDLGHTVALDTARWLVMDLRRPGGQTQFSAPLAAQMEAGPKMERLILWARSHLRAELSVPALAKRVNMSERTFARTFQKETGCTPATWVAGARLESARALLELTQDTVKEIAARCGYDTPETFHRAFRRALQTSPLEYRARFGPARKLRRIPG
jgi:transcriptional regulator GlxA family with amidase domain